MQIDGPYEIIKQTNVTFDITATFIGCNGVNTTTTAKVNDFSEDGYTFVFAFDKSQAQPAIIEQVTKRIHIAHDPL